MKIKFFNIQWDEDNVNLPTEVVDDVPDSMNVALEGADFLNNKFGFCVVDFDFTKEDT